MKKTWHLFEEGMQDYSKILKIMQYFCVIMSEYAFARYHLRSCSRFEDCISRMVDTSQLSDAEDKVLSMSWKKAGVKFSTTRGTTRMFEVMFNLIPFVTKMREIYTDAEQALAMPDDVLRCAQLAFCWLTLITDSIGGVFDNMLFLNRIELRPY